ncbi:MAG TPA: class I SAM-dependent methyltransferase [Steroidobacteraceae bacterium]|nr:class I SAM-dependent methyltransferase [Steroidobacteraceae bacterium]
MAVDLQAFYDQYPYPPPVADLDAYRRRWQESARRRADFHLFWPTRPYREDYSILVAGCGTSQAAKYAIRWPAAQVTGIDISATSLRHTQELKRKYQLDNLQVEQLPLERAGELGKSFDQVVCTGVLHHLPDPDAGLRALRGVLAPHGALHVMVYAPYGRAGIYMLQEFCRRVGFRAPEGDIRELQAALRALPSRHPLTILLQEAADFRNETALADALLNPQDRAYSVPQLLAFLAANGLVFGRWVRQAPYSLQPGLMSRIPRALRLPQIPIEDQYAAAELFRGNMVRHSAIAYRNDAAAIPRIDFDGEAWLGYVPIRMPDTVTLREQLPSGIAAILINRTHVHTDILLPLRPEELGLLEAVDGRRTIGEMLASEAERDAARSLFERLWWHDQVAFDAAADG